MPDLTEQELRILAANGAKDREIAATLRRPMTTLERTLVDQARLAGRIRRKQAKLASLDEEIDKFRAEVEAESRQDEARIKAALEDESTRIVSAAEQEIGAAAAQARRGLRNFAAELAVEQAAKQMVLTPETDRAVIAEFVGDVNKGGQN